MAKIQDIDIPYLEFAEAAAPGTPASGISRIYVKADGLMYSKDDAGVETLMSGGAAGIAATIVDAKGDIIAATAADTVSRLAVGANGTVLTAASGQATGLQWAAPGGATSGTPYRVDYVAITSPVNVTATTEAGADTVITATGVAFDGSTIARIDVFFPRARPAASAAATLIFYLVDGGTSVGEIGRVFSAAASSANTVVQMQHFLTPTAATHTYGIEAAVSTGTGVVGVGAGGSGNIMPGFIAIYKLAV